MPRDLLEIIADVKRTRPQTTFMEEEARAEQEYEMRAAFGPGEKIVNIFTGETYQT